MNEPGVIETSKRYWPIVVVSTLVFGVAALLLSLSRPTQYVASATVVLDETASGDVTASNEGSDRIVASQLEVFRSGLVAEEASRIASEEGYDLSASDLLDHTSFTSLRGTDVIVVEYSGSSADEAETVADSYVAAYDQVRRDQRREANSEVLARLDSAESVLENELSDVQNRINEIEDVRGIDAQIEETLDRISTVQAGLLQETDPEAIETARAQLADLQAQLETLQLAAQIERQSGQLATLLQSRTTLQEELRDVDTRRTELEIQTAVEGSGVAFFSPSTATETDSGAGLPFTVLGGLLLGAMVGIGLAYTFGSRRRTFTEPSEPEVVLETPILAEIPRWSRVDASGQLPVKDDPRSLVAEAFRFSAANLGIRLGDMDLTSASFVSGTVGEGKSTLIANTAMAAANSGKRVLLVDADFGSQEASRLILGDNSLRPGLTDLVLGDIPLESVVSKARVAGSSELMILGRGRVNITAPDFFADPRLKEAMSLLKLRYDMVLVDGPPLLQVAYASTVARLTDGVVLVVTHGSSVRTAQELVRRAGLINTPVLGYIYNKAPRRPGRVPTGGSMTDVLGESPAALRVGRDR